MGLGHVVGIWLRLDLAYMLMKSEPAKPFCHLIMAQIGANLEKHYPSCFIETQH